MIASFESGYRAIVSVRPAVLARHCLRASRPIRGVRSPCLCLAAATQVSYMIRLFNATLRKR